MDLTKIGPGKNIPEEINVIIEIAANGMPVKYEIDKESGAMLVDRFLSTAMRYPCNYGYVPKTLSEDGDPVDVLVITPHPLVTGSVIRARPIGILNMADEAGKDAKLLAVPIAKLSSEYNDIHSPADLPQSQLATIAHFFEHYKDLEPNKWVKVDGWGSAKDACDEILASVARYNES